MAEIVADEYIHAAPAAVYRRFVDIAAWPSWFPGVASTTWLADATWRENAQFRLRLRNPLGVMGQGVATIRMNVPNSVAVWETAMPGFTVINTARFAEEVGGCKVTLRQNVHGALAWLTPFLRGAQSRALAEGLATLKQAVEGQPRR